MHDELRSLVVIFAIAAVTPLLADLPKKVRVPAVVLEILCGILVGPQVLEWVHPTELIHVLSEFGLALLIFLAGMEIDFARVRGGTLNRACSAWVLSLVLGVAVGSVAMVSGFALDNLVIGLTLTTTAIGTLVPILRDAGEIDTEFGTTMMANGALGEFGPIVAITLLLTHNSPGRSVAVLSAFAAVTAGALWLATRPAHPRLQRLLRTTMHTSGQLAVRICVLLTGALVWLAANLGVDILLGAFAAGVIARLFLNGDGSEASHLHDAETRLSSLAFGFFVPLFFVVSGVKLDVKALTHVGTLVRVPVFLALFLVVRGFAVWFVHRKTLAPGLAVPVALMSSTALPLVVVITSIALEEGNMKAGNAAALVGAGLLSVLIFPAVALALNARRVTTADLVAR